MPETVTMTAASSRQLSALSPCLAMTTVTEKYVVGPHGTPFFTKKWSPAEPKAFILFVHGFAEHVRRYDHFFPLVAAHGVHVTAFDRRGDGCTSIMPLAPDSAEAQAFKAEGKAVRHESKKSKRKNGGWAQAMPDIEFFVKRESERARAAGKKLFLHGHSMGGAEVLAFVTRPSPPPNKESVALLAGIIASSPQIRLTHPAPWVQVKAGTLAANVGLGSMMITTPLDHSVRDHLPTLSPRLASPEAPIVTNMQKLSHNSASNESNKADPLCEQVGSVRQMADMLNGGASLDSPAVWSAWPPQLPLLVYHGEEDEITDHKVSRRFAENAKAADKTFRPFPGMYHELHNELEPTPSDVAKVVADWVLARAGEEGNVTVGAAASAAKL